MHVNVGEARAQLVEQIQKAQVLDPLSSMINTCFGTIHVFARQYDLAIIQLRKTLELDPHFPLAYFWIAIAYEQANMYQEAVEACEKAAAHFKAPEMLNELGRAYALAGRRPEAQRVLDELHELSKKRYVGAYYLAVIYGGLDDRDHTFRDPDLAKHL